MKVSRFPVNRKPIRNGGYRNILGGTGGDYSIRGDAVYRRCKVGKDLDVD